MSFWAVVFVVLMVLWLFGGAYGNYTDPQGFKFPVFVSSSLVPWVCVAILGWLVLGH